MNSAFVFSFHLNNNLFSQIIGIQEKPEFSVIVGMGILKISYAIFTRQKHHLLGGSCIVSVINVPFYNNSGTFGQVITVIDRIGIFLVKSGFQESLPELLFSQKLKPVHLIFHPVTGYQALPAHVAKKLLYLI